MGEVVTVRELIEAVRSFRDVQEWGMYHRPKDLAMAIAVESAELLELFLWLGDEDIERLSRNLNFVKKVAGEVSDILIFVLSLVDVMGVNIVERVMEKLRKNEEKYPSSEFRGIRFKRWLIDRLGGTE